MRISTKTLAEGAGGLGAAIAGGDEAYQHGADSGLLTQGRIAQMIAATRAADATAGLHNAQADEQRAQNQLQTPDSIRRNAMTGFGVPLDEENAVNSFLQSGNLGGKYTTPVDNMGPVAPEPAWKEQLGPLARQIMSVQNGLTLGDKNSLNVAKSAGEYANQGRIAQMIAGALPAPRVGQAMAASEGKPLVQGHEFGVVDNFTGAVNDQNPVAQRFGDFRVASTANQNAAAKQHGAAAEADDLGFTPAAIDNAAARYNIDGTLPPMGMGKTGAAGRKAILNRAAVLAGESGVSGDEQRIAQIGNKANTAALSKIQQQQSMVGAFERNFNKNADIVLETTNQIGNTGVPLANKWINAGKRSIAGDPELSAYDAAIKATANEYAKIVSGSMGNTATAESEIKKVEGLLNSAQTPEQVVAVITRMKRETQNRIAGFEEEKAALRATMGSKKPGAPAAHAPGGTPAKSTGATVSNW